MVEQITANAFRNEPERLRKASVLAPQLSQDLSRLADNIEEISNWDVGRDLSQTSRHGIRPGGRPYEQGYPHGGMHNGIGGQIC